MRIIGIVRGATPVQASAISPFGWVGALGHFKDTSGSLITQPYSEHIVS